MRLTNRIELFAVAGISFVLLGAVPRGAEASPFVINLLVPEAEGRGPSGGGDAGLFGMDGRGSIGMTALTLGAREQASGKWRVTSHTSAATASAARREAGPAGISSTVAIGETANLDLGSGDYLTVSGEVAHSILDLASHEVDGGSSGNSTAGLGDVVNNVTHSDSTNPVANAASGSPEAGGFPSAIIDALLPDLAAGIVLPAGETGDDVSTHLISGITSPVVALESVPEPGTLLLLATGLAGLVRRARRPTQ